MRPADPPRFGFWLFAALHVVVWTTVALLTQPNAPLDTVEVVAWGHEWQLGYQNHPPLTAWLGEVARRAGGANPDWSLYLLTELCVVAALWGLWRLALSFVSPSGALVAVLLTGIASRYTWMTLEFNHNVAVLPFYSLAVLCLYRALTARGWRWWLLLGVCLGLGALAKYTIAALGISMLLLLAFDGEARRAARGGRPLVALGAAALIVLPHLVWLVQHRFPSLSYAAARARNAAGLLGHLVHPLEFLGHQVLALGLTLLGVLALLAWPPRRRPVPPGERFKRHFLLAMVLGPASLVVLASLLTGLALHPAWGMPFWTGLALLLLYSLETRDGAPALRRAAALWAAGAAFNVLMGVAEGMSPYLTGEGARIQFPGRLLAMRVTEAWERRFHAPLEQVGGERWLAGNVNFYAPSRPSLLTNFGLGAPDVNEAACPWTSVESFRRHGGVLLWLADRDGTELPASLRAVFPDAQPLPALALPWQTRAPIAPARVGLAIVAPAFPAAPR